MELGHQTQCKCHGISGACHLKTCVKKLPDFRDIGTFLLHKYDSAVKVMADNKGTSLLPKEQSFKRHTPTDLVYTDDSPDFCVPNPIMGSLGTSGRRCAPGDDKLNSCSILCCDKGEEKNFVIVKEHCNCRFQYCCDVHCEVCSKNITSYTCKWHVWNKASYSQDPGPKISTNMTSCRRWKWKRGYKRCAWKWNCWKCMKI